MGSCTQCSQSLPQCCLFIAAQVFAGQVPELNFHELLVKFGEEARLDGTYFFCKMESVLEIARNLETVRPTPTHTHIPFPKGSPVCLAALFGHLSLPATPTIQG